MHTCHHSMSLKEVDLTVKPEAVDLTQVEQNCGHVAQLIQHSSLIEKLMVVRYTPDGKGFSFEHFIVALGENNNLRTFKVAQQNDNTREQITFAKNVLMELMPVFQRQNFTLNELEITFVDKAEDAETKKKCKELFFLLDLNKRFQRKQLLGAAERTPSVQKDWLNVLHSTATSKDITRKLAVSVVFYYLQQNPSLIFQLEGTLLAI